MSAVQSTSREPSSEIRDHYSPENLQVERDRIGKLVARVMQLIMIDHNRRSERYSRDVTLLGRGIWRAEEYALALKTTGNPDRLKWFVDKNIFYNGYAPSKYFKRTEPFQFEVREGVKPSEAITEMTKGFSVLNWTCTCQIAQYRALCTFLGEEKFDRVFLNSGLPLKISHYNDLPNPLLFFLTNQHLSEENPLQVGQKVGFKNHERYRDKHVVGEANVINAIFLGDEKFGALDFPNDGYAASQAIEALVEQYNQSPAILEDFFSPDALQFINLSSNTHLLPTQIDAEELQAHRGGIVSNIIDFNSAIILAVRDLSIVQITRESMYQLKEQLQTKFDRIQV